ncbi:hypothetical protein AWC38_SpisGene20756 [Stylophora pistillata]|uniref:Uncharacterized protein n=1 Tax=Stylophora pistillata TaxID=50429 RepID=A0A2B4R9M1_STYPI|nr:hypothetical protein AWC38_SpisGene20756 [Stylophora pistillata]
MANTFKAFQVFLFLNLQTSCIMALNLSAYYDQFANPLDLPLPLPNISLAKTKVSKECWDAVLKLDDLTIARFIPQVSLKPTRIGAKEISVVCDKKSEYTTGVIITLANCGYILSLCLLGTIVDCSLSFLESHSSNVNKNDAISLVESVHAVTDKDEIPNAQEGNHVTENTYLLGHSPEANSSPLETLSSSQLKMIRKPNPSSLKELVQRFTFQAIQNSSFSVDTFFVLRFHLRGLLAIVAVLLAASFFITATIYSSYDLTGDDYDLVYTKPYCRIPSYLVGMVLGYLLHKAKDWRLPTKAYRFAGVTSLTYGVAFILSVCVEVPAMQLEKLILNRNS